MLKPSVNSEVYFCYYWIGLLSRIIEPRHSWSPIQRLQSYPRLRYPRTSNTHWRAFESDNSRKPMFFIYDKFFILKSVLVRATEGTRAPCFCITDNRRATSTGAAKLAEIE